MTARRVTAFGLIAGLSYTETRRTVPGAVMDLYIYRRRYDDEQHGIKRSARKRCED